MALQVKKELDSGMVANNAYARVMRVRIDVSRGAASVTVAYSLDKKSRDAGLPFIDHQVFPVDGDLSELIIDGKGKPVNIIEYCYGKLKGLEAFKEAVDV